MPTTGSSSWAARGSSTGRRTAANYPWPPAAPSPQDWHGSLWVPRRLQGSWWGFCWGSQWISSPGMWLCCLLLLPPGSRNPKVDFDA